MCLRRLDWNTLAGDGAEETKHTIGCRQIYTPHHLSEWADSWRHISTIRLYSDIHVGTGWKIQDIRQIKDRRYKNKKQPRNSKQHKYSKTKLASFSHLIRHSARKQGGLILQRSRAHTRPHQLKTMLTSCCGYLDDHRSLIWSEGEEWTKILSINMALSSQHEGSKVSRTLLSACCHRAYWEVSICDHA